MILIDIIFGIIILVVIVFAVMVILTITKVDFDNISLWMRGQTDDHLAPDRKAGMIIRKDGKVEFQSTFK